MTEEIDLDDLDVETDDQEEANPGDWFWRGEGDPEDEPTPEWTDAAGTDDGDRAETGESDENGTERETADTEQRKTADTPGEDGDGPAGRVPHVPRENKDKPVGIPIEGGGAGARSAGDAAEKPPDHGGDTAEAGAGTGEAGDSGAGRPAASADEGGGADADASGPHGGDADDMTMALSYGAMKRLEDPQRVMADANAWADWIGIVGDVEAFVINKFQRDNRIDVDFFNGSSQGPAERLADVDETSMFYAERMVLVGRPEDAWMAEAADWEFVPLSEAAGKAGWEYSDDDTS